MIARMARCGDLRGHVASLFIVAAMAALVMPFTPTTPGHGGPTSDGVRYAAAVAVLRGEEVAATEAPYVHRILPLAAVAALPLPARDGFLLLNGLATLATGPLLYALLRRHGAQLPFALLGVVWWAVLPASVRFTVHYPSTLDAMGFALLVALLLLAHRAAWVAFAAVLAAAVLVRENTALVAAVLWLRLLPDGVRSATLRAGLATLPAVILFVAVRAAAPVPPTMWWTQADLVGKHVYELLTRADLPLRYLAAIPLSLGLFAVVPVLAARASAAVLRRGEGWAFYIVGTLVLAAMGGQDHDRFMLWLVPALAVIVFGGAAYLWTDPWRAAALTAIHLVAVRWLWPMDAEGRQLLVAWMDLDRVAAYALVVAAAVLLAWAIVRRTPRLRSAAGSYGAAGR